jgi:hypothetical protein
MAVTLGTQLVWRGYISGTNQVNPQHTLIGNTSLQQVVDSAPSQYRYGAQAQSGVIYTSDATFVIRFWVGYSNTNWANVYYGGTSTVREIVSYSNTVWSLRQYELIPSSSGQLLNKNIELTMNLATTPVDSNTPFNNGTYSFTVDGVNLVNNSNFRTGGTTTLFTSSVTTPSQGKEWVFLPVWDNYSTSDISFPGADNTQIKTAQSSILATSSSNIQGGELFYGDASLVASSSIVAAPGRILLAEAVLGQGSSADRRIYVDDDYFEGIYIGSDYAGIIATLSISANINLNSPAEIDLITGLIMSTAQADLVSNSLVESQASNLISAEVNIVQTSSLTAQASRTLGTDILVAGSSTSVPQARNIIDIGIQYAADWVGLDQDYVGPYFYLDLFTQSQLSAAASVEIIPEANISASSGIVGVGGYFDAGAQMIVGGQAGFNILPVLTGGAGLIFSVNEQLSVETTQTAETGLLFDIESQLSSDTEFNSQGSRFQLIAGAIRAKFLLNAATNLFKSTTIPLQATTDVLATAGKYWSAQTQLVSAFIFDNIRSRIISIDEYYVDKVTREIRNITVFQDQRTAFIPIENQTITVFLEDRINQVDEEARYLRPEPGPAIQVGSRNRRITA